MSNEYYANIWVDNEGFTHSINDLFNQDYENPYACRHGNHICPLCDINKICPSCKGNITIECACDHIFDIFIYRPTGQIFTSG